MTTLRLVCDYTAIADSIPRAPRPCILEALVPEEGAKLHAIKRELVEAIAAAADGEDVSGRRGIVAVDWRQLSALAERGREALKEGEGTTRKSSSFLPSFREVIMTLTDTKFVLDTPSAEGTLKWAKSLLWSGGDRRVLRITLRRAHEVAAMLHERPSPPLSALFSVPVLKRQPKAKTTASDAIVLKPRTLLFDFHKKTMVNSNKGKIHKTIHFSSIISFTNTERKLPSGRGSGFVFDTFETYPYECIAHSEDDRCFVQLLFKHICTQTSGEALMLAKYVRRTVFFGMVEVKGLKPGKNGGWSRFFAILCPTVLLLFPPTALEQPSLKHFARAMNSPKKETIFSTTSTASSAATSTTAFGFGRTLSPSSSPSFFPCSESANNDQASDIDVLPSFIIPLDPSAVSSGEQIHVGVEANDAASIGRLPEFTGDGLSSFPTMITIATDLWEKPVSLRATEKKEMMLWVAAFLECANSWAPLNATVFETEPTMSSERGMIAPLHPPHLSVGGVDSIGVFRGVVREDAFLTFPVTIAFGSCDSAEPPTMRDLFVPLRTEATIAQIAAMTSGSHGTAGKGGKRILTLSPFSFSLHPSSREWQITRASRVITSGTIDEIVSCSTEEAALPRRWDGEIDERKRGVGFSLSMRDSTTMYVFLQNEDERELLDSTLYSLCIGSGPSEALVQQRVMIKSGLISVALVRPKQREAIYLPTTKEREEEDLSYHQRLAVLLPWRLLLFNVKDSKKAGKGASSLAADAGEGSPRLTSRLSTPLGSESAKYAGLPIFSMNLRDVVVRRQDRTSFSLEDGDLVLTLSSEREDLASAWQVAVEIARDFDRALVCASRGFLGISTPVPVSTDGSDRTEDGSGRSSPADSEVSLATAMKETFLSHSGDGSWELEEEATSMSSSLSEEDAQAQSQFVTKETTNEALAISPQLGGSESAHGMNSPAPAPYVRFLDAVSGLPPSGRAKNAPVASCVATAPSANRGRTVSGLDIRRSSTRPSKWPSPFAH